MKIVFEITIGKSNALIFKNTLIIIIVKHFVIIFTKKNIDTRGG